MNGLAMNSQSAQPTALLAQPARNWLCQAAGGAPMAWQGPFRGRGSAAGASGGGLNGG